MAWLFGRRHDKVRRIPVPAGSVVRSTASLMEKRGWTKTAQGLSGPYATPFGTFAGHIEPAGPKYFRVFILNPPEAMQTHPKWVCFHRHGNEGWWRIHLATPPADNDPNAIIRYVEQIVTEALRKRS